MERFNENTNQLGLPPSWPERPIEIRAFPMMPPATLPLAPASFQVWQKSYLFSHGASTSGTKPSFTPFDGKNITLSSSTYDNENPMPSGLTNAPITAAASGSDSGNNPTRAQAASGVQHRMGRKIDPNMDPKKLKRVISNRASAQKSRLKKLQYVAEMEKKIEALQTQIAVLSPQVALLRHQQHMLKVEHKRLNEELSAHTKSKILKDAEIQANRAEVNRLRELYLRLQQQKMQARTMLSPPVWEHGLEQAMNIKFIQSGSERAIHISSNPAQIDEETTMDMNNLKPQQLVEKVWTPLWEPSNGSPRSLQKEDLNSNLGGIEQILEFSLKPTSQNH